MNDPKALETFHRFYALMGFRYVISDARVVRRGDSLEIRIGWKNIGLTPTYDAWKIRYVIEDVKGKEIWSGVSTLDLRTVLPDTKVAPGALNGAIIPHADQFQKVPENGKLWLQIVDPERISPPLALSVKGRNAKGAYPLTP